MALRRELHRRGRRFRVGLKVAGLPRRSIDIAFTRFKLAIFVDGCFWHGCPDHYKPPRTNPEWWAWKVGRNRDRDSDTSLRLGMLGWTVLRFWEHESPEACAGLVEATLAGLGLSDGRS